MKDKDIRQGMESKLPLLCVFLSGLGFSVQTLFIKILADNGFRSTFIFIFIRGIMQMLLSLIFIYQNYKSNPVGVYQLFGTTSFTRFAITMRSLVGFSSISFCFLAVENMPLGDASSLNMLAPLVAAIASYFILGEAWRLPEFYATIISIFGAVLIAKPTFIFQGYHHSSSTYWGVVFALTAALCAGFAYVFIRILGTSAKMPWANVCLVQALGQIILSVPFIVLLRNHFTHRYTIIQCTLLFGGSTLGAISQILMTVGMQREKSAAATAMRMSDVVFGFIWQSLFTQDDVSFLSVVGAILVSSSILIVVVFKQKAQSDSNGISAIELSQFKRMAISTNEEFKNKEFPVSIITHVEFSALTNNNSECSNEDYND